MVHRLLTSTLRKFGLNRPIQYKLYIDWLKRNHMLGHQQLNGTTGEAKETPMPGGQFTPNPRHNFRQRSRSCP